MPRKIIKVKDVAAAAPNTDAADKDNKPNWTIVAEDKEVQEFGQNVLTMSTIDLNKWIRANVNGSTHISDIKAARRRLKNRFYARDHRARQKAF